MIVVGAALAAILVVGGSSGPIAAEAAPTNVYFRVFSMHDQYLSRVGNE